MDESRPGVSYDEAPYRSQPTPYSHPGHLAMVATLRGLRPPPVEQARVLELGCGIGTNLLPMAEDLPGAELIGIDLSARQIAMAQEQAAQLGLRNVRFQVGDLQEVGAELGRFDYILAHGVYSWVPEPVRDKLLALCGSHLAEDGLAYISYNTAPGWSLPGVLRELMLFHARDAGGPGERVARAMAALELLREGIGPQHEAAAQILRAYAERFATYLQGLGPYRDSTVHHDLMSPVNAAVYFHQFWEHAARHGLLYVAEATAPADPGLPGEVAEKLGPQGARRVDAEQYQDFLSMRTLRQSVLTLAREGRDPAGPRPDRVRGLYVRAAVRPRAPRPDLRAPLPERFLGAGGAHLDTAAPLCKAALFHLGAIWPTSIAFPELLEAARGLLGRSAAEEQDADELGRFLLSAQAEHRDLVWFRAHRPALVADAGERPRARPLARLEARGGQSVTSLYHEGIHLDDIQHWLLERLDGSRDRAALLDELVALAQQGALRVEREGERIADVAALRAALGANLERGLHALGRLALLTA